VPPSPTSTAPSKSWSDSVCPSRGRRFALSWPTRRWPPARESARAEASLALSACCEAEFPFGAAWAERVLGRLAALKGPTPTAELLDRPADTFGVSGADLERARTLQERRALARLAAPQSES
jgi:hypothetical protein